MVAQTLARDFDHTLVGLTIEERAKLKDATICLLYTSDAADD